MYLGISVSVFLMRSLFLVDILVVVLDPHRKLGSTPQHLLNALGGILSCKNQYVAFTEQVVRMFVEFYWQEISLMLHQS
jgi:hypothetical protein